MALWKFAEIAAQEELQDNVLKCFAQLLRKELWCWNREMYHKLYLCQKIYTPLLWSSWSYLTFEDVNKSFQKEANQTVLLGISKNVNKDTQVKPKLLNTPTYRNKKAATQNKKWNRNFR